MPVYHKPNFEPSQHSLGCGYGDLALTNSSRGMAAVTGTVLKTTGTAVFTGGWSLGAEALKGKNARYAEASGQADKWRLKYNKCSKKRKDKGKSLYPNNPGKGPFFTDCRESYKEWKHFENKAARLAKELGESLNSKGQLTADTAVMLAEAQARPAQIAEEEYNDTVKDWKANEKRGGKKKSKPNRQNIMDASFDPEGTALTLEGDGDDGFPIWILGIGALLALGGVGYYVMSGPSDEAE